MEEQFTASDGKKIVCLRFEPETAAKAAVVIGHGMNDHKERFAKLAEALVPLGCACWIPDLRGHGDTDPGENRGLLAEQNGFERVVQDLVELSDYASRTCGKVPLYYIGHSFGALLGLALSATFGKYFDGVVLSGPPAPPDPFLDKAGALVVSLGLAIKGLRAPARLPNSMTFGAYARTVPEARTRFDWLTRDPVTVDAYIADPKCNFICTYGFYRDLLHGIRKVYSEGFLESIPPSLPIYLFCGSRDPVIGMKEGYEKFVHLFRSLGILDFESRCYEGGRHEMINEINRDEVIGDVADWFSRHIR